MHASTLRATEKTVKSLVCAHINTQRYMTNKTDSDPANKIDLTCLQDRREHI